MLDAVEAARARNFVVLTGDVHSSWAYDLVRDPYAGNAYDPATGRGAVGVEIVTPAVTSPNGFGEGDVLRERKDFVLKARPHLRWVDADRGYVVVDLRADRLQADWFTVPTVTSRVPDERFAKGLVSEAGRPTSWRRPALRRRRESRTRRLVGSGWAASALGFRSGRRAKPARP